MNNYAFFKFYLFKFRRMIYASHVWHNENEAQASISSYVLNLNFILSITNLIKGATELNP